jgi:hypothetical protein
MIDPVLSKYWNTYQRFSRDMGDLMLKQWTWLASQYWCGVAPWAARPRTESGTPAPEEEGLQALARERARKGLAPPREIYDVQNRNRIDWSELPDWARPSDPELFEGCSHEG